MAAACSQIILNYQMFEKVEEPSPYTGVKVPLWYISTTATDLKYIREFVETYADDSITVDAVGTTCPSMFAPYQKVKPVWWTIPPQTDDNTRPITAYAPNNPKSIAQARRRNVLYAQLRDDVRPRMPLTHPDDLGVVAFHEDIELNAPWEANESMQLRGLLDNSLRNLSPENTEATYDAFGERLKRVLLLAAYNRRRVRDLIKDGFKPMNFRKFVEPGAALECKWVIYAIFVYDKYDPFYSGQVYVGQTRREMRERMIEHMTMHSSFVDVALHAVDVYTPDGGLNALAFVLDVVEPPGDGRTKDDAVKALTRMENRYISLFGAFGFGGLNMKSMEEKNK